MISGIEGLLQDVSKDWLAYLCGQLIWGPRMDFIYKGLQMIWSEWKDGYTRWGCGVLLFSFNAVVPERVVHRYSSKLRWNNTKICLSSHTNLRLIVNMSCCGETDFSVLLEQLRFKSSPLSPVDRLMPRALSSFRSDDNMHCPLLKMDTVEISDTP